MTINPVTLTVSKHELELIRNMLRGPAERDTRIGRIASSALDKVEAALKLQGASK